MRRREFLKYTAAASLAAPFVRAARADSGIVKVGVVGAKTGPLGPGAAVTHFRPIVSGRTKSTRAAGLSSRAAQQRLSW